MYREQGLQRFVVTGVREGGDSLYGVELIVYEELKRAFHANAGRFGSHRASDARTVVAAAFAQLFPSNTDRARAGWFYALAASCMRRLLVEQARAHIHEPHGGSLAWSAKLLKLHVALEQLQAHQPLCARIAELRYFAGCTMDEIAELVSIPVEKAVADLRFARAWLGIQLE